MLLTIAGAATIHAELVRWAQDIEAGSPLQAVFFRLTADRRPPKETRPALSQMIAAAPAQADLYSLRALEDEQQLDFAAAEADWRKYAELATDKGAAQLALADFYHRRLKPAEEVQTLSVVAQAPSPASEQLTPPAAQRSWQAFERSLNLIDAQAMPADLAVAQYRGWIARYPGEPAPYSKLAEYAIARKRFPDAEQAVAAYVKAFPGDEALPVEMRAQIERARGNVTQALATFDSSFRPLWPERLVKAYFGMLQETKSLRRYLERARAAVAANPNDITAASRLYYYYRQQGNRAAAERPLLEYRMRKESRRQPWTADELYTLARLFEDARNYDEAAREYYALYSLGDTRRQEALAGIANVLLTAPEQPIRFGAGDLSYYRDIATMDSYPGFLNGILSLLFNSTYPAQQYASAEQASTAYFHRGRAAALLAVIDKQYPALPQRAELHERLIEAYDTYGENQAVVNAARTYLASFPNTPGRTHIALLMAGAYARRNQVKEEFAAYDALLKELAGNAQNVPLGPGAVREEQASQREASQGRQAARYGPARSPDYARVLDLYVARLVALKRTKEALALLRNEIQRNPNDPGLYERLAGFLEQNRLSAEIEQVYRRAIQQFQNRTWYDKLARWYLRQKQTAEFQKLTEETVKVFSGTELEGYFRTIVAGANLSGALNVQVNRYAHQRFPHNITFVLNLANLYIQTATYNAAEWERLARNYWCYDDNLRVRFFAFLSFTGKLEGELAAIRNAKQADPAASRFLAEGEAWRSHFETAQPAFAAVAADFPAEASIAQRAASVERSLGMTAAAVATEEKLSAYAPRDHGALTRIGETLADNEDFVRARPYWNRIAEIEPGRREGYLEAATVFWDYFLYDDALRQIETGRKNLSDPSLFAYEAGAIYENKRVPARAVEEYVKSALAQEGASAAQSRLIVLARRPQWRALVDAATVRPVSGANPEVNAVDLRAAILEAQNRRADTEALLIALAGRATSFDLLARIDVIASRQGFETVRQRVLERQVSISADPVEKMGLQLALMRYYESQGNAASARRAIDEMYRGHPAILGVVRASADYYWRNKDPRRTVEILTRSAASAYPSLAKQFTLEAVRKSSESADYAAARKLIAPLLSAEPLNAEYVAAMADTYARQGDDRGLVAFYQSKIAESKGRPAEVTASLRRSIIPVLTRTRDYAGAVDQYIEIINRFPEDDGLAREAALYASANGRGDQLRSFYVKTAGGSPRDYRWPVVLARIETALEDYPAAIAAYGRAISVRPDRADLYQQRAGLEERLMRFDEAAADCAKLYDLTYRNPQWMAKAAEIRARQGRVKEAVEALRKAHIEGRPDGAGNYFEIAARLEQWDMLPEARQFAERGLSAAGANLLADAENSTGVQAYSRVMARLRRHAEAWKRLTAAAADDSAKSALDPALVQMAAIVGRYYTPEEKVSFQTFLLERKAEQPDRVDTLFLPFVRTADLVDLEARWVAERMMAEPGPESQGLVTRLSQLQSRRMRHAELGAQLEAYWKVYPAASEKDALLDQAAEAYRAAGDPANELRLLASRFRNSGLAGEHLTRYLELLGTRQPAGLSAIAGGKYPPATRNAAAEAAVRGPDAGLALGVVKARGTGLPPVWTRAHTALTGLYFNQTTPEIKSAFLAALGSGTIGQRAGKPVDRDQLLAGDVWFYYGSRYGVYLAAARQDEPEDYLPAMAEGTPGRAGAYFDLAEHYRETGNPERAAADYENALQLDPLRAQAHDRIANILWRQGKRDEAVARWRAALESFARVQDRRVPPDFWTGVEETLDNIGANHVLAPVKDDASRLLRTYIRRNGAYMADALLRGASAAAGGGAAGAEWIVELARAAHDPAQFLEYVTRASWLTDDQRDILYRRLMDEAQQRVSSTYGEARSNAASLLDSWRVRYADFLTGRKQGARALDVLRRISPEARRTRQYEIGPVEIRATAQAKAMDALFDRYRRGEDAPALDHMRVAAQSLRKDGDAVSARRVLEFVYLCELEQRSFTAPNFLGLAEVRLEEGDVRTAVSLLRRMTLVAGEPFENLDGAAALLEKFKRTAEAAPFREERVKAVPWDRAARARLAELQLASADRSKGAVEALRAVMGEPLAAYETRVQAAALIGRSAPAQAASTELSLLASGNVPPAAAERPFYYDARVAAAGRVGDPAARARLYAEAIAIRPVTGPRGELVLAEFDAGRSQPALSAAEPFFETGGLRWQLQRAETESIREDDELQWISAQFLAATGSTPPARAVMASRLGDAFNTVGRPGAGLLLYRLAALIDGSDALKKKVADAQRAAEIRRENDRRRPAITEALEQDRLVRPRITGGSR